MIWANFCICCKCSGSIESMSKRLSFFHWAALTSLSNSMGYMYCGSISRHSIPTCLFLWQNHILLITVASQSNLNSMLGILWVCCSFWKHLLACFYNYLISSYRGNKKCLLGLWVCTESTDQFGENWYPNNGFPIYKHDIPIHLFRPSSVPIRNVLSFLAAKVCTCLVGSIPKYYIFKCY